MKSSDNERLSKTTGTDIFIIGLGIRGIGQITRDAEQALSLCKTVFTIHAGFGVLEYLHSIGPRVVDLLPEYQEGRHRVKTYQHMAARVVDGALESPPVGLVVYGHPSWLVFPTELISSAATPLNLKVTQLDGVSCIDTVLLDLGLDPAAGGLQIFEATGLVGRNIPVQNMVPCILLQVDVFQTEYYSGNARPAERYLPLLEYLSRFYSPDHEVASVYSSVHPLMKPIIRRLSLKELPDVFSKELVSGTLYIPPQI